MKDSTDRSHLLAEVISEEIVVGKLSPGEKLNEVELAKRFDVSRGPVREALRRLAERNLVVFLPNAGAKVASFTTEYILHLLEIREQLEGVAAKLSAMHMSSKEKADLRVLFEAHAAAVDATEDNSYIQHPADLDFHYVIIKGSRNPILFDILCGDLYPQLRMFRRRHQSTPGRGNRALEEHRRILTAIEENDPELAELFMQKHISAARENLKQMTDIKA